MPNLCNLCHIYAKNMQKICTICTICKKYSKNMPNIFKTYAILEGSVFSMYMQTMHGGTLLMTALPLDFRLGPLMWCHCARAHGSTTVPVH